MTDPAEVLGDRARMSYTTVPSTAPLASAASTAEWIVVVDQDESPLGALPRARLSHHAGEETALAAVRTAPAAVVADVSTALDALLDSPAFRIAAPEAVIAVEGTSIVGLWGGDDLVTEVVNHASRLGQDWSLPGTIRIPQVVRICRYRAGNRMCTASLSFHERPDRMPRCPDPEGMGDHEFGW